MVLKAKYKLLEQLKALKRHNSNIHSSNIRNSKDNNTHNNNVRSSRDNNARTNTSSKLSTQMYGKRHTLHGSQVTMPLEIDEVTLKPVLKRYSKYDDTNKVFVNVDSENSYNYKNCHDNEEYYDEDELAMIESGEYIDDEWYQEISSEEDGQDGSHSGRCNTFSEINVSVNALKCLLKSSKSWTNMRTLWSILNLVQYLPTYYMRIEHRYITGTQPEILQCKGGVLGWRHFNKHIHDMYEGKAPQGKITGFNS